MKTTVKSLREAVKTYQEIAPLSLVTVIEAADLIEELHAHLAALVQQASMGKLTDEEGHDFRMNVALLNAAALLKQVETED